VAAALGAAARLIDEKDAAGAVSVLHEVLRLAEGRGKRRVRLLLARTYLSERSWRRYAFSLLNEMLRENAADADALALLGALYRREGLRARAEATLHQALVSDPGHPEARTHLQAVIGARHRRHEPEAPPSRRPGLVARLLSMGR
jgi:thioredoxin-like negative regulator of GroEL